MPQTLEFRAEDGSRSVQWAASRVNCGRPDRVNPLPGLTLRS